MLARTFERKPLCLAVLHRVEQSSDLGLNRLVAGSVVFEQADVGLSSKVGRKVPTRGQRRD